MGAAKPKSDPARGASDALTAGLYEELRRVAERLFASERRGHTLQPTALVNEACLRIMQGGLPSLPREQQLAIGGRVLRQVLVDHARAHNAAKRGGGSGGGVGGGGVRLELESDALADGERTQIDFDAIHGALDRLRELSPRQAEVVSLRLFSGLSMEQVASVLGVSKRSAEGDWTVARAWLRRELGGAMGAAEP